MGQLLSSHRWCVQLLVFCEASAYLREPDILGDADGENISIIQKTTLTNIFMNDIRQQKPAVNAVARQQQKGLGKYLQYKLKFVVGAPSCEPEAISAAAEAGVTVLTWDDPPFNLRSDHLCQLSVKSSYNKLH
jgi:hypothetical protein